MPLSFGPSPAYRIRQGESCGIIFWSNSPLHSMTGTFRIIYDDGSDDDFSVNRLGSAGTRVAQFAITSRVARHDGFVVSLAVGMANATIVRGQCYAVAFIYNGATPAVGDIASAAAAVTSLAQDYVWFAHPLQLGVYVEAGPAGGNGHIRSIALGDPAANTQLTAQTVPAGAIWLVRAVHAPETAAGAATRSWQVRFTDGTNIIYTGASNQELTGVVSSLEAGLGVPQATIANSLVDMTALPWMYLPAGWTFQPFLNSIAAADDIGASFMQVEEWVVPN